MVARRVSKGFSNIPQDTIAKAEEYDDIEKARQVRQDGDIHPNGKWVWRSSAAGGKGDWRVIKKQDGSSEAPTSAKTEKKEGDKSAKTPKSSSSIEALQKTLENMSVEDLTKLSDIIKRSVAKKEGEIAKKKEKEEWLKKKEEYHLEWRQIDKKTLQHYQDEGLFYCDEMWEIGDGNGEVQVAKMTDEQKQKNWPNEDYGWDDLGEFAVMYANEDYLDFFETKEEAMKVAWDKALEHTENYKPHKPSKSPKKTTEEKTSGSDITKESSEKMQGAIKTVLGQGIKATPKKKTIDKTIFSVGLFENQYGIVNNMKKVRWQSLGILTNIDDDDIKRLKKKYPDISYDGSTQSASKIVQTIIRQSEKIEDVAKNLNESGIMIWDFELVSDNEYRALLRSTRKLPDGSYKHILLTKR